MININSIDAQVLSALRENMSDSDICNSSPEELMDMFLTWEGIIGYTPMLINAWENLKLAQESSPLERLIKYCWDDEYTSYMEEYNTEDPIEHALNNKNQDHIFCALAQLHVRGY